MLGSNHVLVTENEGTIHGIIREEDAGEVETFNGILCPGFVNAHCHLELSHMKGLITEKTGLVDFVEKVVNERHFAEDEIVSAIQRAEDEMIGNGIVAVGDICNNLLTLTQKQQQRISYYNFIEASGWLPEVSQPRFERALSIFNGFTSVTPPGTNSIVPHAPYSVSAELWQRIMPWFINNAVSIHNQETCFEDELFIQGTGDLLRMYQLLKIDNAFHKPTRKSSLQSYYSHLSGAASIILVHNTFTSQADIEFAMRHKRGSQRLSFCLCVNANLYIENALPPIELLRSQNCDIVLGTDSLASNHALSILDEIKTIQRNFPMIPLPEILQWATLNGAKALQMEERIGSFDKGKKPGVILIRNAGGMVMNEETAVQRII